MKSGQSCRVVIPVNLRPLLNHYPKALSRLESGKALAKVWDLLEGQQNREALFYNLLLAHQPGAASTASIFFGSTRLRCWCHRHLSRFSHLTSRKDTSMAKFVVKSMAQIARA
jgi:hypothetical protein